MSENRYLTPEIKAAILKDNEKLSGSMTARAETLTKIHKYSVVTLRNVIRHTVKVNVPLTQQQREQVKVLYNLESGSVRQHKYKSVADKTGVSLATVRLIIKAQEREETKYFNPREAQF